MIKQQQFDIKETGFQQPPPDPQTISWEVSYPFWSNYKHFPVVDQESLRIAMNSWKRITNLSAEQPTEILKNHRYNFQTKYQKLSWLNPPSHRYYLMIDLLGDALNGFCIAPNPLHRIELEASKKEYEDAKARLELARQNAYKRIEAKEAASRVSVTEVTPKLDQSAPSSDSK